METKMKIFIMTLLVFLSSASMLAMMSSGEKLTSIPLIRQNESMPNEGINSLVISPG
jgi:hypothetical protein